MNSRRSVSASSRYSLYDEFKETSILPLRRYIIMSGGESNEPFGFGSQSPAHPHDKHADFPGPGRYDPHEVNEHTESLRGIGTGFTSIVPRRLGFVRGNKNPAPTSYDPKGVDRRVKRQIGIIPKGRKVTCFPDPRETESTPGPGTYEAPKREKRAPTAIFKSKVERDYLPGPPKPPPKFDGRNFILRVT